MLCRGVRLFFADSPYRFPRFLLRLRVQSRGRGFSAFPHARQKHVLEGQKRFGAGLDGTEKEGPLPAFDAADRWLERYFTGTEPGAPPPLLLAGTAFSRAVWAELLLIPYGQTATYGEIAARLGAGRAASRAVGAAVGRNPISLMVPCHRVIGADGAMTGYAGGLERKKWLLALEKDWARKKG